jgi:hypothetical protein
MGSNLVLEIGALLGDTEADAVIEHAVDNAHAGIVVKGSQGTRWRRANAAELLTDAQAAGLQGAWLHYAEPAQNAAEDEAAALMAAIGTLPLGLGVWLDLDGAATLEMGALMEWVRAFTDATNSPRRPVALIVTPQHALQLAGSNPSGRVVLTELEEAEYVTGWALRRDAELDVEGADAVPVYALASLRGLVPVVLGAPEAPVEPPAAHLPPEAEPEHPEPAEAPLSEPEEHEAEAPATELAEVPA